MDAWKYLDLPIELGEGTSPEIKWDTQLSKEETQALASINPSYHMMKAGRSYLYDLEKFEKWMAESDKEFFVVEVVPSGTLRQKKSYVKDQVELAKLADKKWLATVPKDTPFFLVGENDKELVVGMVALRMLGYDAVIVVKK